MGSNQDDYFEQYVLCLVTETNPCHSDGTTDVGFGVIICVKVAPNMAENDNVFLCVYGQVS